MEREWFPGVPESSQAQQITFVTMSTVDDLSYSPSEGQKTRDAAQVAATGRRSWKKLKGKPEAVWPPALEGALIEALEEYRRMEARPSTSKYGVRYPMRNRFVSDYILEKTGKTRTAQQVGSRLQQLWDTCEDSRLSSLLGGFWQRSNSPALPEETMVIHIQLEYPSERHGVLASAPQVHLKPNDMDAPRCLHLMPLSRHWPDPLPPPYPTSSSTLSSFSSLLELVSPFPLSEETTWSVYRDNAVVHQERTAIFPTSPLPNEASQRLYVCDLVPSFWPKLCDSKDPNSITIVQKVRSAREPSSLPLKEASIVYHFNVPDYIYMKPKSRPPPSPYTVEGGLPSNSTPSSPGLPQSYHPSSDSSHRGSSSQGYGYWPSSSHGSYGPQDTGYDLGHRRMHDPSCAIPNPSQSIGGRQYAVHSSPWRQDGHVGGDASPNSYVEPRVTQWEANGHRSFPFSNLPDNGAINPRDGRHDYSRSMGGPSVFGHSTNIAVNNSHIRMDVRPLPAVDSDTPRSYIPRPPLSAVAQGFPDRLRPPAPYSSASVQGRARSRPRPAASPSPSPPPVDPPTAPGRHTAAIAAIFVFVACLVLW
ncbi:hypothetical protein BKA70DRAFT_720760 [Coprinopsis sp. MPI-PUGE-AT-0042]|nr:hypothetical protein BKA70DRAFT_720760 [Coprinopsis sp. MPI-PUGE-AT-0042]